jgi:hypothetical protein
VAAWAAWVVWTSKSNRSALKIGRIFDEIRGLSLGDSLNDEDGERGLPDVFRH